MNDRIAKSLESLRAIIMADADRADLLVALYQLEQMIAPTKPEFRIAGDHVAVDMPAWADTMILGFQDHQFQPRHIRLTHQFTVRDLVRLSKEGRGNVAAYPTMASCAVWIPHAEITPLYSKEER